MSNALKWTDFLLRIGPDLVQLARTLYTRHNGDTTAARRDLGQVRADWLKYDQERLSVDAELAELERRGPS